MTVLMHTLRVDLGDRSYPIYIGRELLRDPAILAKHVSGKQAASMTVCWRPGTIAAPR